MANVFDVNPLGENAKDIYSGEALGAELLKEGLVPDECLNVELRMPADGALTLHYDIYVKREDLPKVRAAIKRLEEKDNHESNPRT